MFKKWLSRGRSSPGDCTAMRKPLPRGRAQLGSSAHVDTFARDNLPPDADWPDLFLDRPEYAYPDFINVGVELTDKMVEQGYGDHTALVGNGRSRTYKELADWSNRIANALVADYALVPGERVLIRSGNNPALVAAWLAATKAGAVVVNTMPMLRAARDEGVPVTVETCPHYLTFAAETIADGATHFKCCPPVREAENREKLWAAIVDGTIDMVVSDHSPCTPALKLLERGDFMNAWGGISALQFGLPVMWTNLKSRGYDLTDLTRLMSEQTAKLAGLANRKGKLVVGHDADIVIWNPDERFTVITELIQHRHKLTPYSGMELLGKIDATFVGGRKVFEDHSFTDGRFGNLIQ